jgi:hypothetical protein
MIDLPLFEKIAVSEEIRKRIWESINRGPKPE